MRLREALADAGPVAYVGDPEAEIGSLAYDSSRVEPGALYFCVPGARADGHDFAPDAVARGAAALVVERRLDLPVPQARVPSSRAAMPAVATRFFGDPTAELLLAGITGTNGKTTTAFLVRHILERAGVRTGLLGTVKRIVGGDEEEVERTTPEAIDLQATFRRMLDTGDRACAMEVSSHALALGRVAGVRFAVAAFTNLTQDHLDFHSDMDDYFAAKRRLFVPDAGTEPAAARLIVNLDDAYGARLAGELAAARPDALVTVSVAGADGSDYRALGTEFDASGSRFEVAVGGRRAAARLPLPGDFNISNALVAVAIVDALGVDLAAAAEALDDAPPVPGRLEPVAAGERFSVLVDYAHTPESLRNALEAVRLLTAGRLIVVFGCGGDRDRAKRPVMGEIAARLSDRAIVTSDNPRSEDPEAIIAEILAGIGDAERDEVEVEVDRRAAIARALEAARPGDSVVVAGKGHEQGQEFEGGRKVPFDDRVVAREELGRLRSKV